MRTGHHLLGAVAGLGVAQALGWPVAAAVGSAVIGAAVAPLPDIDQRRWWNYRRDGQRRDLPRALQHRRLTHWWGLPAAPALLVPALPRPLSWLLASVVAGLLSHLAGDWVFGKRGPQATGWRGPGIPLAPWTHYHGLGLRCGGTAERWVAWPLLAGALVFQCALLIGAL